MTYSPLANPRSTREALDRFGLSAKHALGQNFLVDDNIIGAIVRMAGLSKEASGACAAPVLEIGPGIATLTLALLDCVPVIAVERDRDLVEVLAQTTAPHAERFRLLQGDALKIERAQIEAAARDLGATLPHQLVSNLPYGIAATVVLDWLQRFGFLDTMTVMVQSEVADRMCARVGTKEYGAYTVKLRLVADIVDRFQVPASCFMPAPHIESAVVRIERRADLAVPALLKAACDVADAAFAQRRKNIRNSMQSRYERALVDELLVACDIPATVRGETLGPEQYKEMGRTLLQIQGRDEPSML